LGDDVGMTPGETLFYLREVTTAWSLPRFSNEKIVELQEQQLIERNETDPHLVRLTREGTRQKTAFENRRTPSTINLTNLRRKRSNRK